MHGLLVAIVVVAALLGVLVWRRRRNAEQIGEDDFGAYGEPRNDESSDRGEPR
jgi:hypothetical protein